MKKILLLLFVLSAALLARADNELYYGFYTGTGTLTGVGTERAETYDVAIHFDFPDLVGMTVRGLRIPIRTQATQATDFKAWLSKELTLEDGKTAPDICSVDFDGGKSWVDVDFPEPYVIPEGGFYAGYSFTISGVDISKTADPNKFPIQCIASSEHQDEAFIHTSRTYRKWGSFTSNLAAGKVPALAIRLSGEKVKTRAASLIAPDDTYAYSSVGKSVTVGLTIINHGVEAIKNITYTIEVDGEVTEKTTNFTLQGTYFGRSGTLRCTVPAVNKSGTFPIRFTLTKINGEANEDDSPGTTYSMAYIDEFPVHKPLLEEYTGTWCGWCPRGMAAMEALTELYGDQFVGVAWHNGDPMQITVNYPNDVSGYPNSFLDRVEQNDPFNGSSGSSLGIQNDWKKRCNVISPATLGLTAEWADAAQTVIRVSATVGFIRDFSKNPYRLTYILVADGLKGNTKQWAQQNYFSGNASYMSDPYLSFYAKQSGTIVGLEFNDVAIQRSNSGQESLAESLPAAVVASEPVTHDYSFDISGNTLVQDKTKLRVVAALVNAETGEVVQAEKAGVGAQTAVGTVATGRTAVSERYTDLSGRGVTTLGQGLYLRTTTFSDGTVLTRKLLKR